MKFAKLGGVSGERYVDALPLEPNRATVLREEVTRMAFHASAASRALHHELSHRSSSSSRVHLGRN